MKKLFSLLAFIAFAQISFSQVKAPAPSPSATVKQVVGLTDVTVDYSRPSMKGRVIFGDLVPFGEIWRTGANGSTDIEFSDDFSFNGTNVKAGKYALYTIPSKNSWDVMLYADTELWGSPGDKFDASKVVAKTTVKPTEIGQPVESFTISIDDLQNSGANLVLAWDNTKVVVPFGVKTDVKVEESIASTFGGPSANDYFAAANYYFQEGKDIQKALKWVNKAVELNPNAFWMMKAKAEMQAQAGNYKEAIKTAKESAKAAEKAGNKQYVGFNEDNIAKWKKMK